MISKVIANFYSNFLLLLIIGLISGCSQFSSRPGAITFHNITSRYNAYFLADQDLKEAEFLLKQSYQEDYNQLVPILYPMDSVLSQAVKPQLTDAIKKASIVAEKHQNSKWLDNSYIILGKSRLYLGEWADGLEALRYVYANGNDENDKNDALILLMRAYILKRDFSNALGVAEYLSQQSLKKSSQKEFYLTKAFLHQTKGEYLTSVAILESTFPLLKKSVETARIHFAAGQMYDLLGKYALANTHYKNVGKNKPSYDLGFYSSMNSLQNRVFLNPKTDLTAVGFNKMLKDRKNEDLKDKIYFTMGLLAEHRNQIPEAIGYLQQSAALGERNPTQKAYTYLHLARINYESLEKFEVSKAYYDSALVLLPKEILDYQIVQERKQALDDFVTQFKIVSLEDSLQQLAKLNPIALDAKLDGIIEQQEKDRVAAEKKAQDDLKAAQAVQPKQPGLPQLQMGQERRWALYDPAILSQGKLDFKKNWGNRPLEDDWRRSSKQSKGVIARTVSEASIDSSSQNVAATMEKGSEQWNTIKESLKANIPFDENRYLASQAKKEEALVKLGKIYRFDLKENSRAVSTFRRVITEFPESKYKDELYYLLFLTMDAGSVEKSSWKEKLLAEFPNSTYARLVNDRSPDGSKTNAFKNPVEAYENSYQLYSAGEFDKALTDIERNLPAYKGSILEDKFALLRVFLIGKVRGKEQYTQAITEFIQLYPNSKYISRIKEMQDLSSGSFGRL